MLYLQYKTQANKACCQKGKTHAKNYYIRSTARPAWYAVVIQRGTGEALPLAE
jgi:hypothetical protein